VRVKCVELGITLRPPKTVWHRLRVLIEPTLHRALTLAARRHGMTAGAFARRILTAVLWFNLGDAILAKTTREQKLKAIRASRSLHLIRGVSFTRPAPAPKPKRAPPLIPPPQLDGSIGPHIIERPQPTFEVAPTS
jgi:hypothetical protein